MSLDPEPGIAVTSALVPNPERSMKNEIFPYELRLDILRFRYSCDTVML